jgi:hypothetical protein
MLRLGISYGIPFKRRKGSAGYYLGEMTVGVSSGKTGWGTGYGSITDTPILIGDSEVTAFYWQSGILYVVSTDPSMLKYAYIGYDRFDLIDGEAEVAINPFPASGEKIKVGINRRPTIYPFVFDETFTEMFN